MTPREYYRLSIAVELALSIIEDAAEDFAISTGNAGHGFARKLNEAITLVYDALEALELAKPKGVAS